MSGPAPPERSAGPVCWTRPEPFFGLIYFDSVGLTRVVARSEGPGQSVGRAGDHPSVASLRNKFSYVKEQPQTPITAPKYPKIVKLTCQQL
jgi:hypothetical protein